MGEMERQRVYEATFSVERSNFGKVQGTLDRIAVIMAGFQAISRWEKCMPVFLDRKQVQIEDLFEKNDIVSVTLRCHRGEYCAQKIAFRNMLFQIQLAAKVAE